MNKHVFSNSPRRSQIVLESLENMDQNREQAAPTPAPSTHRLMPFRKALLPVPTQGFSLQAADPPGPHFLGSFSYSLFITLFSFHLSVHLLWVGVSLHGPWILT